jgi:hypothetical protein
VQAAATFRIVVTSSSSRIIFSAMSPRLCKVASGDRAWQFVGAGGVTVPEEVAFWPSSSSPTVSRKPDTEDAEHHQGKRGGLGDDNRPGEPRNLDLLDLLDA